MHTIWVDYIKLTKWIGNLACGIASLSGDLRGSAAVIEDVLVNADCLFVGAGL
jgi:hypothetical protein